MQTTELALFQLGFVRIFAERLDIWSMIWCVKDITTYMKEAWFVKLVQMGSWISFHLGKKENSSIMISQNDLMVSWLHRCFETIDWCFCGDWYYTEDMN
jgi:hypothetical protein